METIRHYIEQPPQSVDGIDLNLAEIDPGPKWNALLGRRTIRKFIAGLSTWHSPNIWSHARNRTFKDKDFCAMCHQETIGSALDVAADVGDAQRWDVPVTVQPGQTEYVSLSNVNSVQPSRTPHNQ